MSCCEGMCCRESSRLGVRCALPDDDLTRLKHVGVILSAFKVFYVKVM